MSAAEPVSFAGGAGEVRGDLFRAASPRRGALLLLHGSGQQRQSWRDAGGDLARGGWDVYALDARGHGDSAWSASGGYQIDDFAGDLRRIVAQLGEPVVVVGASLGGMTGLIAEGEAAGSLRALVLVDVVARIDMRGVRRVHGFMRAHSDGFASLADAVDAVAAFTPDRPTPPTEAGLRRSLVQGSDGRWRWHWDPASLPSAEDPLRGATPERAARAARSLRVPVLLVRGTESDVVGEEGLEEMASLIPRSVIARIPGGHMVVGDDNSRFVGSVLDFLDDAEIDTSA